MQFKYLDKINSSASLKSLCNENKDIENAIAEEIRTYITETVLKNGGHLSSSLGVVELTVALHLVFDTPADSIVFDVGHQCYAHKIITGRRNDFESLRKQNGISGFPKRSESEYDSFDTGHSSTSVSAAVGIARAKKLKADNSCTVAVIGDGAMTGGMAFEAINDAGESNLPIIVVLNDNKMAISSTVGALGNHLSKLRTSRRYLSLKKRTSSFLNKIPVVGKSISAFLENIKNKVKYMLVPNVLFESMGFTYLGPIDGHDIKQVKNALSLAKQSKRPILVHIVTIKGKGYEPAEKNSEKYHGVSAKGSVHNKNSNSAIVGQTLVALAKENKDIIAVTAAMPSGTGLIPFSEKYPERFFDVAIAEQHAVTMAAGAATKGLLPYVAIYSTFLQRAYDQLVHDVGLQRLPVVFGVDRAGLVGEDGETHQGVYDIAYMLTVPNMCIMSPSCIYELESMIHLAFSLKRPVAIRYNRGSLPERKTNVPVEFGKWEEILPVKRVNIIATGRLVETAQEVSKQLSTAVGLINARFINPVDFEMLERIKKESYIVITLEDGITSAGFGAKIAQLLSKENIAVYNFGVPSYPIPQGTVEQQDELCGISKQKLLKRIKTIIGEK